MIECELVFSLTYFVFFLYIENSENLKLVFYIIENVLRSHAGIVLLFFSLSIYFFSISFTPQVLFPIA